MSQDELESSCSMDIIESVPEDEIESDGPFYLNNRFIASEILVLLTTHALLIVLSWGFSPCT